MESIYHLQTQSSDSNSANFFILVPSVILMSAGSKRTHFVVPASEQRLSIVLNCVHWLGGHDMARDAAEAATPTLPG